MSGVPVNAPVAVSKIAHSGVPVIEYVRVVFASSSDPLGVNEYATSSLTVVDGVPVIVGASFVFTTSIVKAAKLTASELLSVTLITISLYVPTSPLSGIPVNAPVSVAKSAQSGVPVIEYIRVVFASASAPLGVNEYATSSLTVVDGVPVIVGASFVFTTSIVKAAKLTASELLSVTLITISSDIPT